MPSSSLSSSQPSRPSRPDGASRLQPPGTWANDRDAFLRAQAHPWYRLVADLFDVVLRTTYDHAGSQGLRALPFPLTTRTITCPSGMGSDSVPVPVTVNGVDTYLADSMQFMLEYGCRIGGQGCHGVLPSFRGDEPDATHLGQFTHSEAEIVGGLDRLIDYVEGYVRSLATAIVDEQGARLAREIGDVSHVERMAACDRGFERLTFREAARLVADVPGAVVVSGSARHLSRIGERALLERVGEFLWVTHFDHLGVPFYQAFADGDETLARNGDLFFGPGEVVGSGQRHSTGEQVRRALALHEVPESEYAWYVRLKDALPMETAGFGLGVERYLMWVLRHDDIRDIPLVSRIAEPPRWPPSVDRP
ncbi:MAG: amino acid--tRNA ligase-related protein [Frankiaceae bacterium]